MPSEKRQRQDEGRLNRRLSEVAESKKQQRNRTARTLAIIIGVIVLVALGFSLLGGDDKDETTVASGSTTTTAAADDTDGGEAGTPIAVQYPGTGKAITGETPCPAADGSEERTTSFAQAPPTCIDSGKTYTATVETTEGNMTFELDQAAAPVTVNNFVVLARYHYYDGVPFHRIIPGFVDQAGTPVDQAGPDIESTPGYEIDDELPTSTDPASVYPDGTLAMANRGKSPEGKGTNTSQFFIVVDDGGSRLQVSYTPFGKVTEGLDVAKKINAFGDEATNGEPTKDIRITKVTINES